MDLYFPLIRVSLMPFSSGENPSPFLKMYAENYDVLEFIDPQTISSEVYGTDPSEGFVDDLFQVLHRLPKERSHVDRSVSMTPCIFLHPDVIDDYPLGKLPEGDYLLAPLLQSMIPILRKMKVVMMKKVIQ